MVGVRREGVRLVGLKNAEKQAISVKASENLFFLVLCCSRIRAPLRLSRLCHGASCAISKHVNGGHEDAKIDAELRLPPKSVPSDAAHKGTLVSGDQRRNHQLKSQTKKVCLRWIGKTGLADDTDKVMHN
jgi:hypothetical protein